MPTRRPGSAQITIELRQAIAGGELIPGQQLPSMGELARRHGVTAVTVRRALSDLAAEGLIEITHGVGTFVADRVRQFDLLPSFQAQLGEQGLLLETRLCARSARVRHSEAAVALGLSAGTELAAISRLRLVDGLPVALQYSYAGPDLRAALLDCPADASLYTHIAAATGRTAFSAEETFHAALLPDGVAELLGGTGCGWKSLRLTRDAAGRPLLFDEAFFLAERLRLHLRRSASGTSAECEILLRAPTSGQTGGDRRDEESQ